MAKNYKYNRVQNEKFNITGELSDDGKVITYINEDKDELTIDVAKCFSPFKGQAITLTIATKLDMDLSDEFEEDEE